MSGSPGTQQLQELSQQLQALEQEIAELRTEIESFETEQSEIDEAIDAIETLDTGSTVQVPLGGGAYVRAEVQDIDEIIVGFGGGYAAEQDQSDAIETLGRKRDALDERIAEVEGEIDELEDQSDQLEQQAQQLQGQLQQQQMQQMQQMQGDPGDE